MIPQAATIADSGIGLGPRFPLSTTPIARSGAIVVGTGLGYSSIVNGPSGTIPVGEPTKGTAIVIQAADSSGATETEPPETTAVSAANTGVGSQTGPAYSYDQITSPVTNALNTVQNAQIPGWVWLAAIGLLVYFWLD